ncbi:MAG: FAD-binding oxidoreductase [Alphaproteobacteria bacterium]|nr:FAD-binding oxidoreductase [Alphaproteobacteria bacterium]
MIPTQAEIVIVGGGAIGCAVAYHLARLGKRDVLLLEKSRLTHGATWHAAGLIGQLRTQQNLTRMMQTSAQLYARLEAETGQATGWHGTGSLRVAASPARWREFQRLDALASKFGFEMHLVPPAECARLFPPIDLRGVVGGAFVPSDGYIDPASVTQALAKGARQGGVAIREGVCVTGLKLAKGRVAAVETDQVTIACDAVVNAGGMWGRAIGALAGVEVAVCAVEHQYLVTEPIAGLPRGLPSFRDPDGNYYVKPEVGGLAFGGWESDTKPFGRDGIRPDFGPELLPPDFDRFEPLGAAATSRIPALATAGIKRMINGPIPITPDGEPILGKAPGIDNLFLACGFTSGIAAAGGAGLAVARWIADGDPGLDLAFLDPRRFAATVRSEDELYDRAVKAYASYYALSATRSRHGVGRVEGLKMIRMASVATVLALMAGAPAAAQTFQAPPIPAPPAPAAPPPPSGMVIERYQVEETAAFRQSVCRGRPDGYYCGAGTNRQLLYQCVAGQIANELSCPGGCDSATLSCKQEFGVKGIDPPRPQ